MKPILVYCLLFVGSFARAAIDLEVKITRFAFTGEHYMFKSAESKKLFSSLFEEGKLTFKTFRPEKKLKAQASDFGSKTPIGSEVYSLTFKDLNEMKTFAEKLPASPQYPFFGGREWGLFVAVRDFALKTKDASLLKIFEHKASSEERKNSANEMLDELYSPILNRVK